MQRCGPGPQSRGSNDACRNWQYAVQDDKVCIYCILLHVHVCTCALVTELEVILLLGCKKGPRDFEGYCRRRLSVHDTLIETCTVQYRDAVVVSAVLCIGKREKRKERENSQRPGKKEDWNDGEVKKNESNDGPAVC